MAHFVSPSRGLHTRLSKRYLRCIRRYGTSGLPSDERSQCDWIYPTGQHSMSQPKPMGVDQLATTLSMPASSLVPVSLSSILGLLSMEG